ncbi:pseudouridylate synthase TRUB2, mitochondrial [Diorhabda sublineata]|uniref:pseudouridylate synthase TRUB2, mitochondrial n=1 Tax=Diorhabda sublineata TaxID=1163346 RepID=UPI0024E0A21B|nr:pseudouridylate synthase TRUB2, mitochondrial [Diorhabda sublineata]
MITADSVQLWNALKGIICVYKPAEVSVRNLRKKLIHKLCTDLSELDEKLRTPLINQQITSNVPLISETTNPTTNETSITRSLIENEVEVEENPTVDLSYHPLVVGPRYLHEDLSVSWSNYLGWNTSGVLIFGLRAGTQFAKYIRENRSTRAYRISGTLGKATDNGFKSGKVVERSTWKFIKEFHIQKFLSTMQASHQQKIFEMYGLDMQSQLAYELAVKGPIRPANSKIPIIYGIKCIDFQAPNFTLEIQCVNEDEQFLINLIHEIGLKLHSTAHTTGIKCIRHSCFKLEHTLLPKHWTLEHIVNNMDMCNEMLRKNEQILKQTNVALN